jgi:CRP-like cAMP-binding protein
METEAISPKSPSLRFENLPRGGTLVEGEGFRIQMGSYPETIKDTMKTEKGVPDLYLLPDDLFDTHLGVSNADLEFPVYFNYFIRQQKCRFICHRHQLKPIIRVLREAVSGPFNFSLEDEYPEGAKSFGYPDLKKEMKFYKEDPKSPRGYWGLKDMIEILIFDKNRQVVVDGVSITSLGRNNYRFEDTSGQLEVEFRPTPEPSLKGFNLDAGHIQGCFYQPPVFGVTVIGSGHGFDTESKTSGFIIWLDGKGVLVDPPVDSTFWMQHQKVNTRLIGDLILTHCHADHDSGTLQKIMEEGRIRVHTTRTVMDSFVAKYCALTGLQESEFRALFEFHPLRIGMQTTIAGARFLFKYNLHPIPTLGFQVEFEGRFFYYSCDTLYDPEFIQSLFERGILPEERMYDLLDVPWQSDLIFHEAGIPPIHTPISVLNDLPPDVKARTFLVHVSESAIPEDSGLRIAEPGTANTFEIDVPTPQKSLAYKILDVVTNIDLFSDMKFKKALECLAITHHSTFQAGEMIIKRDTYGDRFYMILSGEVEVVHESLPRRLFFSRYDYIGETALILNKPRNADIVARSRSELLYIEKEDFLRFLRDTPLPKMFKRLDMNRSVGARWTFEKHRILAALSPLQKNLLMCYLEADHVPEGTSLFEPGDPVDWYYLVDSGEVLLQRKEREVVLGPGAFVGEFGPSLELDNHSSRALALSDLEVYKLKGTEMKAFISSYPGTYVRMARSLSDTFKQQGRPATGVS